MSRKSHSFSPQTLSALSVLGRQIASQRKLLRWTQSAMAERAGISEGTLQAVEKGAPTATIGIVFELADLVGIPLVGATDPMSRQLIDSRLALLPSRVDTPRTGVNDDF
jgi:transcriptional regulator with XRE-family HTH domain